MALLNWEKLKSPKTTEEDIANNLIWKAKKFGGDDPRVEIRKSFHWYNGKSYPDNINYGAQVVITVRMKEGDNPNILISTNGKMGLSFNDFALINASVEEAIEELSKNNK